MCNNQCNYYYYYYLLLFIIIYYYLLLFIIVIIYLLLIIIYYYYYYCFCSTGRVACWVLLSFRSHCAAASSLARLWQTGRRRAWPAGLPSRGYRRGNRPPPWLCFIKVIFFQFLNYFYYFSLFWNLLLHYTVFLLYF